MFFCSGAHIGLMGAPPASLTGPVAGDNTGDMVSSTNLVPLRVPQSKKINSNYARENSDYSVVFKRSALGRQEFYKKPKNKIRLEQKMV